MLLCWSLLNIPGSNSSGITFGAALLSSPLCVLYSRRVHYKATEEIGPGDIIHCILLRSDSPSSYFSVQVVSQHFQQAGEQETKGFKLTLQPQRQVIYFGELSTKRFTTFNLKIVIFG